MTQETVNYLVPPESVTEAPGESAVYDLAVLTGKQVLVVLRITNIIEQESLQVSIWGSADGKDWGKKPLFSFPQQFYQGVTPAAVDLRQLPEVRFVQARWVVNRWGRGYPRPHFGFAVEIQELGPA